MKILFAPAKEMNPAQALNQNWQLNAKSQAIVDQLLALSDKELQTALKLTDKQVALNRSYLGDFHKVVTYPAIQLYHGLAYRQLQLDNLTPDQVTYAQDHLRILSALYGPIAAFEPIKPYRLDFNLPLKVQGQSLKQHWGHDFDEAFQEGELILNLASDEFASRLTPSRYQWIDFDFYEVQDGQIKRHSTISKKGRGLMVNYLIQQQVTELAAVRNFQDQGYQFVTDASNDHHLVFQRSSH